MDGGSDPYKPCHFLKECNENFQMQYVNCFNRPKFLAEVSINLQKMHFFRQFNPNKAELFEGSFFWEGVGSI